MPVDLPPEVRARLGLPPIPADDGSAALPGSAPNFGGLDPSVVQGLGWAPPPPPTDAPSLASANTPPPQQLPSMAGQPLPGGPATAPDYQVPVSAFGGTPPTGAPRGAAPTAQQGAPAQRAPQAAKPLSFDQQLANLQQREQDTEAAQTGAIQAGVEAQQGLHAEQLKSYATADETIKANAAQRKAEDERYQTIYEKNRAQTAADRQAIDSHKYNPNKFMDQMGVGDHLRWGIAQILAGIGQGMMRQGGPNPVTQMLQQKIHDANQAQQMERDNLVQKLGFDKETGQDAATYHATRAAALDKADGLAFTALGKSLEEAAIKSGDPMARANGLKEAANIRAMGDERLKSYIQLQSQHDHQQAELGIQRQQVGIAGGHLALAQQAERRAQKLQDLEYGPGGFKEQELGIKAADEMRKALKDQRQKVADEGVNNPVTGDPLLTARGRAMMSQADQIEAASRKNPAQAAAAYVQHLRDQATTPQGQAQVAKLEVQIKSDPATAQAVADGYVAQLRDTAKSTEVATISDKVARREVQDGVKWGQDLINTTSKIKSFLTKDPDITDREGWAKLQAEYGTAMVEYARAIGARASSRELDAISKHIMTYDPNSLVDRTFRKAPGAAALDGLQDAVKSGVDTLLKSHGIKDGWTPSSPLEQPAETFGGETAAEIGGKEADLGYKYIADPILHPIDTALGRRSESAMANVAAEGALGRTIPVGKTVQTSDYGLDPADERKAHAAIARADTASNAERARIIDSIAAPIVSAQRPSLAAGLLNLVRDQDPKMYQEILAKLPAEDVKAIQRFDAGRAAAIAGKGPIPSTEEALKTLSPEARRAGAGE